MTTCKYLFITLNTLLKNLSVELHRTVKRFTFDELHERVVEAEVGGETGVEAQTGGRGRLAPPPEVDGLLASCQVLRQHLHALQHHQHSHSCVLFTRSDSYLQSTPDFTGFTIQKGVYGHTCLLSPRPRWIYCDQTFILRLSHKQRSSFYSMGKVMFQSTLAARPYCAPKWWFLLHCQKIH